jgi:23S rRNA (adenine2503-C2)-methyltransferase
LLTPAALREWVAGEGLPAFRVEQILRWVYQRGVSDLAEMTDVGKALRERLAARFVLPHLVEPVVVESRDGTAKLLFRLDGGAAVETVIIPDGTRTTVCLSSQAGCAMGCRFCATARLGLLRSLSAAEIVGQLLAVRRRLGETRPVTNVVFMGMGEPLANFDAVVEAIEVLGADWGFGLSARRITVSTVGLLPQLQRLVAETQAGVAVSLTATTDALRDQLMPVNRRYPVEQVMETCRQLPIAQRRRLTFEYVLLAGVNDSVDDARRLVRLLHGIRAKINLIPFNPFPGAEYRPPPTTQVRRFQEVLLAARISATVRKTRGRDVQAACGQLAATADRNSRGESRC